MDVTARQASHADEDAVLGLLREGRAPLPDQRGGALWLERQAIPEPLESWLAHAVGSNRWLVELAEIDGVALGVLVAELETVDDVTIAIAREVFVVAEARGVGLGEELMDATVAWARSHNCVGIDGYALPGDRATKNFFETFGLVARGIVVHRSLAAAPDDR